MAVNVIRDDRPAPKPKKMNSKVLRWLGQWFDVEKWLGGREFPVKYIDSALFLLGLGLIVVFFRINAERQVRQLRKATEEVNNLRAAYTIRKAHYVKMGKASEIAPKVAKSGLKESREAPKQVVVSSKQ
jgi:hypothetical protein